MDNDAAEREKAGGLKTGKAGPGFDWVRDSHRGRMAKTLENLLKVAKREARRAEPSPLRVKWFNTVCYITQTYNSLLRDTDYDELRAEMTRLQQKVKKIGEERYQWTQADSGRDERETGQSDAATGGPGPG